MNSNSNLRQISGHGAKFGRKKEEAIAALISKRSVEEAALSVGLSKKTLLRWQQDPEFAEEFHQVRLKHVRQADVRFQQGAPAAAVTVLSVMVDPQTPAQSRLRAAEIVLERGQTGLVQEDIEARIARLEKQAA